MTTIVMNTLNHAVTEYGWSFQSITPTHAGSTAGLHVLGGETDAGTAITGEIRTGLSGGSKKLGVGSVYVAVQGAGDGIVRVQGLTEGWEYPLGVRAGGVSRVKPGKGIRENYLGFGYRNVAGADFRLDRIEADIVESPKRSV